MTIQHAFNDYQERLVPPVCLTPQDGIFTSGYYDLNPWDRGMEYHLALKMPFQDHIPSPADKAVLGVVDLNHGLSFLPLVETFAWNHQQGSRQQWLLNEPHIFIYNDAVLKNNRWHTFSCLYDFKKRKKAGELPLPVYCFSPDGVNAITLNFGRLHNRMGYAYAGAAAGRPDSNVPDDDGIWHIDIHSGKTKILCSLKQMADRLPFKYENDDAYAFLSELKYNGDGSRIMALLTFLLPDKKTWRWYLFTMDCNGHDLKCLLHPFYMDGISHYIWGRTPREIAVDANWRYKNTEYEKEEKDIIVFNEDEMKFNILAEGITLPTSGHFRFSPDGKWLLSDTYPVWGTFKQQLLLIDIENRKKILIGDYYHGKQSLFKGGSLIRGDQNLRCDLHPRWRQDGKAVSFDSIMNGDRKIYMVELNGIISY